VAFATAVIDQMDPALFQAVLQQGSEHFPIIPKMDTRSQ
jgi:hypothetical protein